MQVHYLCDTEEDSKKYLEPILEIWHQKSPYFQGEEVIFEVVKLLSRGFTKAITFLARFGEPGKERITRVFKLDYYDNILKEAKSAMTLDHTISAKFFCRLKNNPVEIKWQDEIGEEFGVIEYEYAGDMGAVETVDTLFSFIFDQYKNQDSKISQIGEGISKILDDVVQGLKTKVYKRTTHYNVNGFDVYKRKLGHFQPDFINQYLANAPAYLKALFKGSGDSLFNTLHTTLKMQLDIHYTSDYIHGDLNPTNILVYKGYDRAYGTLIDFLEMEIKHKEDFTPYFWDFARLEGELTLAFFTKGFIKPDRITRDLPKLMQSLFSMEPITWESKELAAASDILIRLRRSYFRTEGLTLDISYNSPETIKSFYYNLLVFYVFYIKFENSELEVLLALYIAQTIAKQISKIDSKWVAERIAEMASEPEEPGAKRKKVLIPLLSLIALLLVAIPGYYFINPKGTSEIAQLSEHLLDKLREANNLLEVELPKEAMPIYEELLKTSTEKKSPAIFAEIKNQQGICYYLLSFSKNRELNLKKSLFSHKEALRIFKPEKYAEQYAKTQTYLGKTYVQFSVVRDKPGNIKKAFEALEKALKVFTVEKYPVEHAISQKELGIAYQKYAEVNEKKKNLTRAIEIVEKSLKTLSKEKFPKEYAGAHNCLGNCYNLRSGIKEEDPVKNLTKAIEHYKKSLEVRTLEKYVFHYGTTQNNLGIAFKNLGIAYKNLGHPQEQNIQQNLEKAIDAFKKALKVLTVENFPFYYALGQLNLGSVYIDYAQIYKEKKEREDKLKKAINILTNALKVYTLGNYPVYYSLVKYNFGSAYYFLSQEENQKENLLKAIDFYDEALQILTFSKYPVRFGAIQLNKGNTYSTLSIIENEPDNIKKAIGSFEQALKFYTKKTHFHNYGYIYKEIGYLLSQLAILEEKEKNINKAIASYQEALTVFTEKKSPEEYKDIQDSINEIQPK